MHITILTDSIENLVAKLQPSNESRRNLYIEFVFENDHPIVVHPFHNSKKLEPENLTRESLSYDVHLIDDRYGHQNWIEMCKDC